ncbi:PucR family transcriptional regulator [Desulfitobacterium chlororespirans]|uniref:PucR C-terminal helix-turn-helix domain-containing protein n=1 Tax=Desulfitobacterium chlororespirans DSM 11544 TaxID=1121395 RepID=A0A1M7SNR8_9FIRM|nr:helix-turn-helix domain-containing protein [Desulfitobacterium chlororespirans]SHN60131.1 PucR C-terminal helix-turn-helix domain-containing protein [Desulfitobacterium chlororespirans DSM 11544]
MKLNTDILFDNLNQSIMLESYGPKKIELTLGRPKLYNGASHEFKANHIYISHVEQLPPAPVLGNGVVILCVGGTPPPPYLNDKCVCFITRDHTDLFTAFDLVQQIFDKYDEWDTGLRNALNTSASIKEMVRISFPIFENPIIVIDANFRVQAYSSIIDTRDDLAIYRPDENGNIRMNAMSEHINTYGNSMNVDKPFLMMARNVPLFTMNLFEKKIYIGNLTIPFVLRQHRQSDIVLAQYLAKFIESSFKKYSTILSGSHINILRGILQDLLSCLQVDSTRMRYLSGNFNGHYICIAMKLGYRSHKVPVEYLCNIIEDSFPGCVAFEYESVIVTFFDVKKIPCDERTLTDKVKELLQDMDLIAGASYSFTNLSMARLYYRQACVALEMGSATHPELCYYPFHDYVLHYMISHCMGEFPPELLLTKGLRQLQVHDLTSQVNYVQTLRIYLNNNMNLAKTADDLFVHRSTLLTRLKRIESLLQTDLKDSDQRLRLLISLKIMEANEKVTTTCNDPGEFVNHELTLAEPRKFQILESIYK